MKRLELVYWYTLEFGLVEEGGSLRTYGAGVLSSFGEMERMKAEAELRKLDFADASARPYDPTQYQDEEKKRVLEAIDRKIAGKQVIESARTEETGPSAQVIDLAEALRASLGRRPAANGTPGRGLAERAEPAAVGIAKERKPAKRVAKTEEAAPARSRARK